MQNVPLKTPMAAYFTIAKKQFDNVFVTYFFNKMRVSFLTMNLKKKSK